MLLSKLPTTISDTIFTGLWEGAIDGTLRLLLQTGLAVHQTRKGSKVRYYSVNQICQSYTPRANLERLGITKLK